MTSTSSQTKNDCVIVGLSNASGRPYDTIKSELETINISFFGSQPLIGRCGIQHAVLTRWLNDNGWIKKTSIPRRGQEKISGIVRLISNKRVSGHLVYMKDGKVFDSFYPNGCELKTYQMTHTKCHISTIWIEPVKVVNSSDVDFDFLRSLDD